MPRTARIFIENACYHILARGNQKQKVFLEVRDFHIYLRLMHKYKLKYGCRIYAYCLMPNHIHMVMESPFGFKAMSAFMHGINHTYAMIFNSKYGRTGHLWQDRYKNMVVLKDEYLINLINYVEFNPVRSGLVSYPADFTWSSYKGRVMGENNLIIDDIRLIEAGQIQS